MVPAFTNTASGAGAVNAGAVNAAYQNERLLM